MTNDTVDYSSVNPSLLKQRLVLSFDRVLGLPVGTLTGSFRRKLEEVFDAHYPIFRKSALRDLMSGWITGVPKPVLDVRPVSLKGLEMVLLLADFVETLFWEETQAAIREASPLLRKEIQEATDLFGKSKIPSLKKMILDRAEAKVSIPTPKKKAVKGRSKKKRKNQYA